MASSSIVMGLVALVFCTWAVSLAGIASIQDKCEPGWSTALSGIAGFSSGLPCMRLFRYYWFIVSLEAVLIFGLAGALAAGAFAKTRSAWLGLFCVGTLLYIQMTNTFLTMQSQTDDSTDSIKHRVRTMVAGSIMTATVNCFLIIALGMTEESTPAEAAVAEKAAAV
ncbi:hypothetical protein GPECTOR_36g16 [Gonium pectorale]|uniref:Uncharacterized protein n=1 Tax=Gonium pectorale TaxID=33097 RepID=A0A150GBT0_GONPE|nr:hypothetical protein GPECTOR_36g16 [Gonium pectorale]|eukprot:KXZ47289.1 hypothetical protein GPECTOR_36g16 [Gonium pectorale]